MFLLKAAPVVLLPVLLFVPAADQDEAGAKTPEPDKGAVAQAEKVQKDEDIERLIRELGSDHFKAREGAKQKLLKLGAGALSALKKASASSDLEAARRAQLLYEQIQRSLREEAVKQGVAKAMAEGVDLFVERLAAKGKPLTDLEWAIAAGIFQEVIQKAEKLGFSKQQYFDYSRLPIMSPPGPEHPGKGTCCNLRFVGSHDWSKLSMMADSMILTPGPIQHNKMFSTCFAITNGGFKVSGVGEASVVICDGKVEAKSSASIVVANGPIEGSNSASLLVSNSTITSPHVVDSILVAGGDVTVEGDLARSKIISRGKARFQEFKDRRIKNVVKENQEEIPELVKFFQPAQLGLVLSNSLGVVQVKKDSVFARAGFHEGDVVAEIDGQKVMSYDEFRTLLRRKVVQGGANFALRRHAETLILNVPFKQ